MFRVFIPFVVIFQTLLFLDLIVFIVAGEDGQGRVGAEPTDGLGGFGLDLGEEGGIGWLIWGA